MLLHRYVGCVDGAVEFLGMLDSVLGHFVYLGFELGPRLEFGFCFFAFECGFEEQEDEVGSLPVIFLGFGARVN